MTKTIWKYGLSGGEENMFSADLPKDAKVLSADFEDTRFVIWAITERQEGTATERRWFHIAGTDHDMHEGILGTRFLNRIDVKVSNAFGDYIQRYHAFDGGWQPGT